MAIINENVKLDIKCEKNRVFIMVYSGEKVLGICK